MAEAEADRALTETIARFGLESLSSQPSLCRNTLRDKLPDSPRETALLVTALEAGVPSRLRTESRISDVETVAAQLADGLEHSHGLSPESARWAVQTWAAALDLSNAPTVPNRGGIEAPEGATVLRTPSAEAAGGPPEPAPAAGGATVVPTPAQPAGPLAAAADTTSPPTPGDEGTVLRPGTGAAPAPPPAGSPPAAAPPSPPAPPGAPKPGGGRRGRLILAIAAVIVVVGAVAAVAVIVFGGSSKKPTGAAGHSTSGHSNVAPPAGHVTSSSTSSAPATTTGFLAISPVLAHRGDHEGYPQETIPAFLQAAQRGFTIETDIRWSSDGVAIINHDATTGLGMVCSGGPYTVANTSWATLQSRCRTTPSESKDGKSYGIPTFDSTVQQISKISGATVFAEIKTNQTTKQNEEFLATLRKYDMVDRAVVTSFYSSYLDNFYNVASEAGVKVRTLRFASAEQPTSLADLRRIHAWGVVFLMEKGKTLPAYVTSVKQAGIQMGIGTTSPPGPGDGPTQWQQAKTLGAEFVLTDKPSSYHTWLASN